MSTPINIIAIVARNGAIGRGGDQPFHIAADFRRFKALTMGHPVIMGRRTFEALPKGALPGRRNIVVTRQPDWTAPGAERAGSLDEAIGMCGDSTEGLFVIGGGQIYSRAIGLADRLYITEVYADVPDADTFFPAIDSTKWQKTDEEGAGTDPRSGARYVFAVYTRKQ